MVLIQNSSADRLGLNPVGLNKWEKHFFKKIVRPWPNAISLWKETFGLERCSHGLSCPIKQGDSYRVLEELGAWVTSFDA